MPDYKWPEADQRTLIGKRITRVDSPLKVSGQAKYTYDVNRPGMLFGKMVRSPYAHCRVVSIDTSAAEKMPGVKAIQIVQAPGSQIFWQGDEVVAVAAVDERTAEDAVRAIKVQYQKLSHLVGGPLSEDDLEDALSNQVPEAQLIDMINKQGVSFKVSENYLKELKGYEVPDSILNALRAAPYHEVKEGTAAHSSYQKAAAITVGDPDKGFADSDVVSQGVYGIPVITHCCLETHGSGSEWTGEDKLLVHMSTQNVSGIPAQMAEPLKIPASNIRVHQDHIGGGFGSKFSPDKWGIFTAQLAKKARSATRN
ncbi:MAG: hypothetical protein DMG68_16090 [Acidobacteria bacterium]|nr:MAG: hypothetical protein DMG68_16090 [Acidobacteriota bacterium]